MQEILFRATHRKELNSPIDSHAIDSRWTARDSSSPAGRRRSRLRLSGLLSLCVGFAGAFFFSGAAVAEDEPEAQAALARGNNEFALELYQQLRREPGNLFFSPSSISTAFGMAYGGARGTTAEEMADVLRFRLEPDALHRAFAEWQASLTDPPRERPAEQRRLRPRRAPQAEEKPEPPYLLKMANRLWGQRNFEFHDSYLELTRQFYGAPLEEVDFVRRPEESRKTINVWVEEQTEQKIRDLLPEGSITTDTRLVLTNAVYFLGTWSSPFSKDSTRDAPFHLTPDREIEVPMMHQQGRFRVAQFDDLQLLELPYRGDRLSMVVLLPREIDGLAELEQRFSAAKLEEWMSKLQPRSVNVDLPRFETTSQFHLTDTMKAMGMRLAFEPDQADFSGMSDRDDLHISSVVHKAFVDVNEEGTEAAAATGVVISITAAPADPVEFRADRPFLFLIRDQKTGAILFLGRLSNPEK